QFRASRDQRLAIELTMKVQDETHIGREFIIGSDQEPPKSPRLLRRERPWVVPIDRVGVRLSVLGERPTPRCLSNKPDHGRVTQQVVRAAHRVLVLAIALEELFDIWNVEEFPNGPASSTRELSKEQVPIAQAQG